MTTPIGPPVEDWTDDGAYARLGELTQQDFAWEYVRRNRKFREAPPIFAATQSKSGNVSVWRDAGTDIDPQWGLSFRRKSRNQRA